jgi:L,D-peptidoglycan transpeptidase YkuD (ErfK/YbiS/YcfS/YnhG family)
MKGFYRHIIVKKRPGHVSQGLLSVGGRTFVCALGRGGISANKREGDGATPLRSMALVTAYYRADRIRPRAARLLMIPLNAQSGWCDARDDRNYNCFVTMPYPANHEIMQRKDALYDVVIVLNYNMQPRLKGRGSAIFFHVAKPGLTPTEGCVALPANVLLRLLPRFSPRTVLTVSR